MARGLEDLGWSLECMGVGIIMNKPLTSTSGKRTCLPTHLISAVNLRKWVAVVFAKYCLEFMKVSMIDAAQSASMDWGGSIYPRLITMLRNWSKCNIILLSHCLPSSQLIMRGIVPSLYVKVQSANFNYLPLLCGT